LRLKVDKGAEMDFTPPQIKAVLFDFMGVLMFPSSQYRADETVDAIDRIIGRVTDDPAFKRSVMADYRLDEPAFQNILARIVDKYEPFPPLWDLLPALRKSCKLAIINNGTYLTFPGFDAKLNISEQFDAFISSAVAGVRKPHRQIYLDACHRLDVQPRDCLFMDDSPDNIQGAQQVGMRTIFWKNRDEGFQKLIEVLKSSDLIE
jgi:HAD superfamily hydrolase (TIGR01509 family)